MQCERRVCASVTYLQIVRVQEMRARAQRRLFVLVLRVQQLRQVVQRGRRAGAGLAGAGAAAAAAAHHAAQPSHAPHAGAPRCEGKEGKPVVNREPSIAYDLATLHGPLYEVLSPFIQYERYRSFLRIVS